MTIKQLTQNGSVLERVICYRFDDAKSSSVAALTLQFKGGEKLTLSASCDTDEIAWNMPEGTELKPTDSASAVPALVRAYGLLVTWCWEMTNHQGYFDAVQLELSDSALTQTMILQFKVAASSIEIYEVSRISLSQNG